MSRRIDICPTCKGRGEIIVDNWLTEGMTEEELAKEKEKALADIVEVVRCKDCKHYCLSDFRKRNEPKWCEMFDDGYFYPQPDDYCSYGERREG